MTMPNWERRGAPEKAILGGFAVAGVLTGLGWLLSRPFRGLGEPRTP